MADRAAAVQAIRDVGEQGEGPTNEGEQSHFERFLGIFRGSGGIAPFPAPEEWSPTRNVPTNPKVQNITQVRTKRWAQLVDIHYALLLGFLEHYLLASGHDRSILIGWIFAEMRSRVGFIARHLTTMPREGAGAPPPVAAIAFTLPADLHLPDEEAARWGVHRERTRAAIAKIQEMRGADADDAQDAYLADLLASDQSRLALIDATAPRPAAPSFARDILPLFRQKDIQHMRFRDVDLRTYDGVRANARLILDRVGGSGGPQMPPAPDQRWTKPQIDLLERWITDGFPR